MSDRDSDWMAAQVADHVAVGLALGPLLPAVRAVADVLCAAFEAGGRLYTFGNGGSAADAQHFCGEVIGHYRRDRRPLPAMTLSTDTTVITCIANDYSFDTVFARQVEALAGPADVVAAFSTSGRSPNIVAGLKAARTTGSTTVLFGGGNGGPARQWADHLLLSPSTQTPRIQEAHTLMLHLISEQIDAWAAGEPK
ncbi:SIS domain-containing protein [Parafrigoribacterium mesophilum]|uniref:D-sedoheptulose-7-phosphate isomerase n=1 Tax=Parafrigoribacterium mesophilum TaxID=433646 RepID=UPI0031FBEDDC